MWINVQIHMQNLPEADQHSCQIGVICKLTDDPDPLFQILDTDIKQDRPQHRTLQGRRCSAARGSGEGGRQGQGWAERGPGQEHQHPGSAQGWGEAAEAVQNASGRDGAAPGASALSLGPALPGPAAPATLSLLPNPTERLLSLLLLQAMAAKITKILLVLAILQYGLRADAQAVKAVGKALTQQEEQCNQEMTWLARAGRITKILVLLGILQYAMRVDHSSVKVMEELLKQHEKERIVEMAQLLVMEKQHGLTPGRLLVLACQEWWFWVGAEILLVLFGIYWLPRQSSFDYDDGSQQETSTSAQEQMKEEEKVCEDNPESYDTPEKPPDKSWALWRLFWRDTPVAVGSSDQEICCATSPPS
ncbi:uncharacterized protein [Anomalospiza imberbis]|uniref:uncharacterized protein n=1 Tax=Anomalospiza imberbis TaxID=187417 RepID=UPI00358E5AD3